MAMNGKQSSKVSSDSAEGNGRQSEDYRERDPLTQTGTASFPGFIGKHRLQASITNLNNQIAIIQEELENLETTGGSSTVCKEVIASVESSPDPLLPLTKGSVDAAWDRWFGGAHNSRNHKRWI